MLTIIQQLCSMKQKHTKYTQKNANKLTGGVRFSFSSGNCYVHSVWVLVKWQKRLWVDIPKVHYSEGVIFQKVHYKHTITVITVGFSNYTGSVRCVFSFFVLWKMRIPVQFNSYLDTAPTFWSFGVPSSGNVPSRMPDQLHGIYCHQTFVLQPALPCLRNYSKRTF